jgi:1,4-dihydroxy-6-naphthoate synthase
MPLELAFSPCPNDTFIFDALVHGRLDEAWHPDTVHLADVEALNRRALDGLADVTKLSFGTLPLVADRYQVLDAGSALGFGCGPLLIARNQQMPADWKGKKVAIPGRNTTANLLLSLALPGIVDKVEMLFSEIEEAVAKGHVDAGLIIHESRFTYAAKGLHALMDLGDWWERAYRLPVPLGCIVVRRSLPEALKLEIEHSIRRSVEYAFANPEASKDYVACHAQEMNPEVMQQHIELYVNRFSISLGLEARQAIEQMLDSSLRLGMIKHRPEKLFLG